MDLSQCLVRAGLLGFVLSCPSAWADLINNGDFEAMPFDDRWGAGAGAAIAVHEGLVTGSTQAAVVPAAGVLFQSLPGDPDPEDFVVDLYFAGTIGDNSPSRFFNVHLWGVDGAFAASSPAVNLRVDLLGRVQVFDGGGWVNIGSLTASASVDGNGDGDLDDVEDTVHTHRLQITARGFGSSDAEYDVAISAANSDILGRR